MNIETRRSCYMPTRDLLFLRDLIAFDGYYYQALSLSAEPLGEVPQPLVSREDMIKCDPATIRKIIREEFYGL